MAPTRERAQGKTRRRMWLWLSRFLAAAPLAAVLLLLGGACQHEQHLIVQAYQNGKALGRWQLECHSPGTSTPVLVDGGSLNIEPAEGVDVGTIRFRAGAVLFESTEVVR
jgi:hypothetical protein